MPENGHEKSRKRTKNGEPRRREVAGDFLRLDAAWCPFSINRRRRFDICPE
jgi:hypothetical protein